MFKKKRKKEVRKEKALLVIDSGPNVLGISKQ